MSAIKYWQWSSLNSLLANSLFQWAACCYRNLEGWGFFSLLVGILDNLVFSINSAIFVSLCKCIKIHPYSTWLFKKLVHKMWAVFSSSYFWSQNTFVNNSVYFAILIVGKTFEDALFHSSLVWLGFFFSFLFCFPKRYMVKYRIFLSAMYSLQSAVTEMINCSGWKIRLFSESSLSDRS